MSLLWLLLLCPPLLSLLHLLCSKLLNVLPWIPLPAVTRRRRLPLPPGTMGWPYVGETFRLYAKDPIAFFTEKQKRYGSVFKTRILGCPAVIISGPEAAKFVLVSSAAQFKPTFPASKERLLGRQAIFFQEGQYHTQLRRVVLRAFGPDAIRDKVASIEAVAVSAIRSWDGRLINTFNEMKTYAFHVALQSIFGGDPPSCIEEIKQCYYTLEKGYNSMAINLPGTLFHKAVRARRQLGRRVAEILASRREREMEATDLLGSFMEGKAALTDEQISDNIIGVIFAARDTTASVLTWIVKYLTENPDHLRAVTDEQEEVMRSKEKGGDGDKHLTWADTKNMPFTSRVLQETLRVASVLTFTFREAVEDVEYEGYLIPKGWKVMPLLRSIHHSADPFPDPEKFDPTRFEVAPKPNTFLPFGNGHRHCPGNQLARLEILVLLHHLTTKYRWSLEETGSGIQFAPFAVPMNGLPMTVFSLIKT